MTDTNTANDFWGPPLTPEEEAYLLEQERLCGADYTTGGHDPYGTSCELEKGHYPKTDHRGRDPFGGDGWVEWQGGGLCVGDPLPHDNVRWIPGS